MDSSFMRDRRCKNSNQFSTRKFSQFATNGENFTPRLFNLCQWTSPMSLGINKVRWLWFGVVITHSSTVLALHNLSASSLNSINGRPLSCSTIVTLHRYKFRAASENHELTLKAIMRKPRGLFQCHSAAITRYQLWIDRIKPWINLRASSIAYIHSMLKLKLLDSYLQNPVSPLVGSLPPAFTI